MAHRASRDDLSGNPMPFSPEWDVPGCPNRDWSMHYSPFISPQWPAPGSKLYYCPITPLGGDSYDMDIAEATWNPAAFKRGDVNADGAMDLADAIFVLDYLFAEGPTPTCLDAADASDDGTMDIADAVAVLGNLFGGAGDLPDPFGECGADPTADTLGCQSFPACEQL